MRVRYSFSSRHTGRARDSPKNLKQKQKYPALLKKIVDQSQIILEVLDARFVEETRNKDLEQEIYGRGKKIIFVINKADLSPKHNNLPEPYALVSCKDRKGVRQLRDRIKMIAKSLEPDKEGKIMVGIVGYPNTGKSSLINILIGKGSAAVGSDAGFTKGIQKLRLSSEITLLDSPGVIPEKEYSSSDNKLHSLNTKVGARSFSQVKNPEQVVHEIALAYPGALDEHYGIDSGNDSEVLIEHLGRKKHLLLKKDNVDTDKTARFILKEWQEGKIYVDKYKH